MTERLYYRDARLARFRATVTALQEGGRKVYLDRTAFYPTSGGQPHDTGTIDDIAVTDVVDDGDEIAHVLAAPLTSAGGEVECVVDWARRYDHMQQHTGQHLLSAVFESLLGMKTTSVHFGPLSSTLDLTAGTDQSPQPGGSVQRDTAVLDAGSLRAVEERVNELIAQALPVTVSFEDAAEATGLRKESHRAGQLRIVSIEGIDRSACGGTHVASTSEIGPLLLRGQERVRSSVRVEFVCGQRALARARRDLEILSAVARHNSASIDDVATLSAAQSIRLQELESENRKLVESLQRYEADELYRGATPNAEGMRTILQRRSTGGADASRGLALSTTEHSRVVFIAASVDPPAILLACSGDTGLDAGRLLKPLLQSAGGRGGGSPRLAQGSLPTAIAVESVLAQLMVRGT